jgi:hypothetical protein
MLEKELARLAGDNWQVNALSFDLPARPSLNAPLQSVLDISTSPFASRPTGHGHRSTSSITSLASPPPASAPAQSAAEAAAHVEQVRLLVLGMEQRLQEREERLQRSIERAQEEGQRFEQMRREVLSAPAGS